MKGTGTEDADVRSTPREGEAPRKFVPERTSPPPALASFKKVLRPFFGAVALIFIGLAGYDLWSRWDGSRVTVRWLPFLGAFVFAALAMILQMIAWRALIVHLTGRAMAPRLSARLFLDSQMARYTPGKVGLAVVRIAGAESVGVRPRVMAASLAIELLSWCGVGSAMGTALVGLSVRSTELSPFVSGGSLGVAGLAMAGLVLLSTVDRTRSPRVVQKLLGGEGSGPFIPKVVPLWHGAHFLAWIACGTLSGLSVGAPWDVALLVGGLLCVAIVAGFVALLAPAGAGVREAIMTVGCAPFLGPSGAVAVGVLTRVVSLGSDVLLFFWFRFRARNANENPTSPKS